MVVSSGATKPAIGKPTLRESLSEWLRGAIGLRAEVHRQVSDGMVVMHERTDRFSLGDREMASPTAAVFEIDNGRITAWREYFDMSPFTGP